MRAVQVRRSKRPRRAPASAEARAASPPPRHHPGRTHARAPVGGQQMCPTRCQDRIDALERELVAMHLSAFPSAPRVPKQRAGTERRAPDADNLDLRLLRLRLPSVPKAPRPPAPKKRRRQAPWNQANMNARLNALLFPHGRPGNPWGLPDAPGPRHLRAHAGPWNAALQAEMNRRLRRLRYSGINGHKSNSDASNNTDWHPNSGTNGTNGTNGSSSNDDDNAVRAARHRPRRRIAL